LFYGQAWDLSEQQLVDCTTGYGNHGCQGGYPSYALTWVRDHGLSTEAVYPYVGQQRACARAGGEFRISQVLGVSGCNGLENGILSRPLSVTVDASNWAHYSSGVFGNCAASINHCVLLVGIDPQGVWKIKNSWGTGWGENGFIRLNPGNTCGICAYAGIYVA
jgi:cathepsin L